MATLPIYQVDVFADRLFAGNPAAVCPLQAWLPDGVMQSIGAENNLAETAFFVADETGASDFLLRWFTPSIEIELCGHATLASGHVLFNELGWKRDSIRFRTLRAGILSVSRREGKLWLDLPARMPAAIAQAPAMLAEGLRAAPLEVLATGNKYFAYYDDPAVVVGLQPEIGALRKLAGMGVVVTAPGRGAGEDFVSRFFAPAMGVDEDPATGSAHCLLVPWWAARLGRRELFATQVSPRGARFECRLEGERVFMSGKVVPYLKGEICVP